MKRIILIAVMTMAGGAALAHGGAGGGGSMRVAAWQAAHPPICAQDGNKLVLISNPSLPCPNQ